MSNKEIVVSLADSQRFDAAIKGHKKREALSILHEVMGVELVDSSFTRGNSIHDAPGVEGGAPMFDVARGIYPEDFYQGRYRDYGSGDNRKDAHAFECMLDAEAKPNARVTIYRAVEKSGPKEILPGDWVTPSQAYAKDHAKAHISGPTKILKKTVRACELFTDGNSVQEWGYHPQERLPSLKEGFTLQECVNGTLFEQNHLFGKLNDEQKERLGAHAGFQKSVSVNYTLSSLFLDKSSDQQLSMLVEATVALESFRETGQFAELFDALDPDGKAVGFWRVRDGICDRLKAVGLNLVEVAGFGHVFAQMQPHLAQEPAILGMYAEANPARTNEHIRSAVPESRKFPVYNPAEAALATFPVYVDEMVRLLSEKGAGAALVDQDTKSFFFMDGGELCNIELADGDQLLQPSATYSKDDACIVSPEAWDHEEGCWQVSTPEETRRLVLEPKFVQISFDAELGLAVKRVEQEEAPGLGM